MPCQLTIDSMRLRQVDLPPRAVCTDAIRPFVTQEALLLTVRRSDGREGTGYAYPPQAPGLGIEWDWDAIATRQNTDRTLYRATP